MFISTNLITSKSQLNAMPIKRNIVVTTEKYINSLRTKGSTIYFTGG